MRNLFLILARYHAFFLFILLQVLCFWIIVQHNHYHRSFIINAANHLTGSTHQTVADLRAYLYLRSVNDSLAAENARLHLLLQNMAAKDRPSGYIHRDIIHNQVYRVMNARIVNNSTRKMINYFTINRGRRDGIESQMGVISSSGAVGIIKDVSDNFAVGISILHKDIGISAKIAESNYHGIVVWDGKDPRIVIVKDIPAHAPVKKGQRVVTTGFSSVFPENIPIGIIAACEKDAGSGFWDIQVKLAANMETLNYIYVIHFLMKEEKQQLEESVESR